MYIPTNVQESSLLSISCPAFIVFLFFVYLLFTYFLMMAILSRIPHRWYLIVLFLCMLLIISSVELLLLCLLSIYMSSLEKYLFRSFSHLCIGLFVFLVLPCMSCWCILEINPLSVGSFAIIFSHYEGCLFTLLVSFLCYAEAFQFNQVPLVYYCFYFHYSRRWVIEDLTLIYVIKCSAYVFL